MLSLSRYVVKPLAQIESGHFFVLKPDNQGAMLAFMTEHPSIGNIRRFIALSNKGVLIAPTLLQMKGDQIMACDLAKSVEIVTSPISAGINISPWNEGMHDACIVRTGSTSGIQARSPAGPQSGTYAFNIEDGAMLDITTGYCCFEEWDVVAVDPPDGVSATIGSYRPSP